MTEKINNEPIEKTLFQKVVASSAIGCSRVIFTFGIGHPFDLVKTRMQANPYIESGHLLANDIYKQTGVRGFYVGGIPNLSRALFKETYRSPQRGFTKSFLDNSLPDFSGKKDFVNTATGLLMAGTDTFLICPLERLKVWMMTNNNKDKKFSQFFSQQPNVQATVSDLFRGLKPSFVRSGMSWTSYLVAEEKIWLKMKELSPRVNKGDESLPLAEQLIVGTLGGMINCLCTLPFDTVKTQMQKKEFIDSKKINEVLGKLYNEHGIKGLYAGWQIKLIHYAIVGVITSNVIHEVDKIWAAPKPKPKVG